jgi:hypothetical protein
MKASTLSSDLMFLSSVVMTETACSASSSLLACSSLVINLWNFVNKLRSSLCSLNNLSQTSVTNQSKSNRRLIFHSAIANFCLFSSLHVNQHKQVPSEQREILTPDNPVFLHYIACLRYSIRICDCRAAKIIFI